MKPVPTTATTKMRSASRNQSTGVACRSHSATAAARQHGGSSRLG